MTALGALFCVAYLIALRRGVAGVLAVMASAMPFFDSAAITAGSFAISPFYLGAFLLLALGAPSALRGTVRGADWLLVGLLAVGLLTTLLGPSLFPRTRVLSSGLDLDQQVDALSVVSYSLSGVAQCAYLALNVGLVLIARRRDLDARWLDTGMAVGTVVAFSSWIANAVGIAWPVDFFSNSTRNFYAELPDRARAQYAEPSHLGVWALVALSYFLVRLLRARGPGQRLAAGGLAAMSALSFASAASGTAIIGGALAFVVVAAGALIRADPRRVLSAPLTRRSIVLVLAAVVAVAAAAPVVLEVLQDVVVDKQGTQSDVTRAFANAQGLRIAVETSGLGIGLGANRASSLVALLLSTVGGLGLLLVVAILVVAVRRGIAAGRVEVVVALVAFVCAGVVGFADFSSSILWLLVAFASSSGRPSGAWRADPGAPAGVVVDDARALPAAPRTRGGGVVRSAAGWR